MDTVASFLRKNILELYNSKNELNNKKLNVLISEQPFHNYQYKLKETTEKKFAERVRVKIIKLSNHDSRGIAKLN